MNVETLSHRFSSFKGFNLLGRFTTRTSASFREDDFIRISRMGFTFVRLPLSYRYWLVGDDPFALDEEKLAEIDEAVAFGIRHGLHVCLNLHRAPGFSVAEDFVEPFNLWKDEEALRAFLFHWEHLARRYRDVPEESLSFNPVNEPKNVGPEMSRDDCLRVMVRFIEVMRAISPRRPLVIDGISWGSEPMPELLPYGVIQSCRGYVPLPLTHYGAAWVKGVDWTKPEWPGEFEAETWDKKRLAQWYAPWQELERAGGVVHCGEFGCYNRTDHSVAMNWMEDLLTFFRECGWGWALWNFRGPFGPYESKRPDVSYEVEDGLLVDRDMQRLLCQYAAEP